MTLHVTQPAAVTEWVTINQEAQDHCDAVMTQIGAESAGPQVGWRLSTRATYNRPSELSAR
jgi:hypothetical protein